MQRTHSLAAKAPFNLEATVRVLQRRPANRIEYFENGCYRRLVSTPDGAALVETVNEGSVDAPRLRWCIRSGDADEKTIATALQRILGLAIDPQPLQHLTEQEPQLRPTARALRGMRPPRFDGWYEAFGNVIPFQQVSLEAGIAIAGRFIERYGDYVDFDDRRYFGFPETSVIADTGIDALRRCGFSRTKANALRDIATQIATGKLPEAEIEALPTADAIARLKQTRGIGPWTAGLVMLRGLGRLDVFPPGDVGAMKGLNKLLGLDADESLQTVVERFGDYRGFLYFHALGRGLLDRGLIQPT